MTNQETKELVREKYGEAAVQGRSCCARVNPMKSGCCNEIGETYANVEGYVPEADLGLGCGLPTQHAGLKPGMTVLDLGSGAGNDVFVARREVGEAGRVIGVDFTPEMLKLANANRDKLGYTNVEFLQGEIEDLPVASDSVDVVISNCVLNLVPDKAKAFAEIRRVLKPGGHFCVSDVVLEGALPDKLRKAAELYVGCVAGALQKEDYLSIVRAAGFSDVRIATERETPIADEHLEAHLPPEEVAAYRATGARVLSITVTAKKPAAKAPCCGPNCC